MKKTFIITLILILSIVLSGYSGSVEEIDTTTDILDVESLKDYQKVYQSEDYGVCSVSATKTYMDYRAITAKGSTQYRYIQANMKIDEATGFLVDEDGFIGVALGSYYGVIGDRYYITLESGVVLPVVKVEEKADGDTIGGCSHGSDGSVIEFVIDTDYAASSDLFNRTGNGLINSGNYNNYDLFRGEIAKVEKVKDELNPNYVEFVTNESININSRNIFNYASGY